MEISNKNSSLAPVQQQKQVVNAALESDTDRRRQEARLEQIDARRKAQETLQQSRLKRRQLAEQQAEAQAERRLQGRLVTDARQERTHRMDDIAHARAMQNKIEQTYSENRQKRVDDQQQRETVQRQQDIQSQQYAAIDLVV